MTVAFLRRINSLKHTVDSQGTFFENLGTNGLV